MKGLVAFLLVLCSCAVFVNSLSIPVSPHEEKCVWLEAKEGDQVHLYFEVISGGRLDIDVMLSDPSNQEVFAGEGENEGSYSFIAKVTGRFRLCFGNQMGSSSELKEISFDFTTATSTTGILAHPEHLTPIEEAVLQLSEGINAVREDAKYLRAREEHLREVTESTYEKLRSMAILEAALLVCMSAGQIYYLRRVFEVKTRI